MPHWVNELPTTGTGRLSSPRKSEPRAKWGQPSLDANSRHSPPMDFIYSVEGVSETPQLQQCRKLIDESTRMYMIIFNPNFWLSLFHCNLLVVMGTFYCQKNLVVGDFTCPLGTTLPQSVSTKLKREFLAYHWQESWFPDCREKTRERVCAFMYWWERKWKKWIKHTPILYWSQW